MYLTKSLMEARQSLVPSSAKIAPLVDRMDWLVAYPYGSDSIKYTFDVSSSTEAQVWQVAASTLTTFNSVQQVATRAALDKVTAITGIQFVEVASGASADWHFANTNLGGVGAGYTANRYQYSSNTDGLVTSFQMESYIYLDNGQNAWATGAPSIGTQGFETLLHEMGHALGLKHPFSGTSQLPAQEDNTGYTVMSYTRTGTPKTDYQSYDVAALRYLYGTDGLTGIGAERPRLQLRGGFGHDLVVGTPDNDTLAGEAGNDTIEGGDGVDTATFSAARSQYTVTRNGASVTVVGPDGTDLLTDVERFRFSDGTLALDPANDLSGRAYRLYRAALGRVPDTVGLGYQTNRLDQGISLEDVGAGFIASPEFVSKYGALSNAQYVEQLYRNVLGRGAATDEIGYHVTRLNGGVSRQGVLIGFSESPENIANVAPLVSGGVWFT